MNIDADVIIIGAGAAGISAAIELQKANLTYLILEARDRIGGRVYTDDETFKPIPVDLGASWIHSYGNENPIFDYYHSLHEKSEEIKMGNICRYIDYDGQTFSSETFYQAQSIFSKIYFQLELFPYNNKNKEDKSIEETIQSDYNRLIKTDGAVKRLVDLFLSGEEQYEGSNLSNLSAKYFGTGSGTGSNQWVSFGYGTLLNRIVNKHNLSVRLNTFVTHINATETDFIEIKTLNNPNVLYCRRVIITVPLGCLKRETIQFNPALPEWKSQAIQEMGVGLMNKLILQFQNHFWDPNLGSILHASNEQRGRFRLTVFIPPPQNILILFVTGKFAQELEQLSDAEIIEEVMQFLRQVFPNTTVEKPINYRFTRWLQDPLSYGSYANFAVHSSPHTVEQLAKATSNDRIHWAGEHANIDKDSNEWTIGCVDSAFLSGQRAAMTICHQLCPSDQSDNTDF